MSIVPLKMIYVLHKTYLRVNLPLPGGFMTRDDLKDYYKTNWAGVARKIGTSPAQISIWGRKGYIPEVWQLKIEKITRRKLKAGV